jgi:hypothetical protein
MMVNSKQMEIYASHLPEAGPLHPVGELTTTSAEETTLWGGHTVQTYFLRVHGIVLEHPNLPCLTTIGGPVRGRAEMLHRDMFPLELLMVTSGRKKGGEVAPPVGPLEMLLRGIDLVLRGIWMVLVLGVTDFGRLLRSTIAPGTRPAPEPIVRPGPERTTRFGRALDHQPRPPLGKWPRQPVRQPPLDRPTRVFGNRLGFGVPRAGRAGFRARAERTPSHLSTWAGTDFRLATQATTVEGTGVDRDSPTREWAVESQAPS